MDGLCLPIKCPNDGAQAMKQYLNSNGFYSIVLMSLVDAEYWFIWASVEAPISTHNSALLQYTDLWIIISNVVEQVEDIEIPPLILGDGPFPLGTFMIQPHGYAVLPDDKRYFYCR